MNTRDRNGHPKATLGLALALPILIALTGCGAEVAGASVTAAALAASQAQQAQAQQAQVLSDFKKAQEATGERAASAADQ